MELDALNQPLTMIVLPKFHRKKVLHLAHEKSGHISKQKTQKLIKCSFVWPLLAKDIASHCNTCDSC